MTKLVALLVVVLAGAWFVWPRKRPEENAPPREHRELTLDRLQLTDAEGNVRMRLGVDDRGEPEIALLDKGGIKRLSLAVRTLDAGAADADYVSEVTLHDRSGEPTILLQHTDNAHHGDWQELVFARGAGEYRHEYLSLGTDLDLGIAEGPHLRMGSRESKHALALNTGAFGLYPFIQLSGSPNLDPMDADAESRERPLLLLGHSLDHVKDPHSFGLWMRRGSQIVESTLDD